MELIKFDVPLQPGTHTTTIRQETHASAHKLLIWIQDKEQQENRNNETKTDGLCVVLRQVGTEHGIRIEVSKQSFGIQDRAHNQTKLTSGVITIPYLDALLQISVAGGKKIQNLATALCIGARLSKSSVKDLCDLLWCKRKQFPRLEAELQKIVSNNETYPP